MKSNAGDEITSAKIFKMFKIRLPLLNVNSRVRIMLHKSKQKIGEYNTWHLQINHMVDSSCKSLVFQEIHC